MVEHILKSFLLNLIFSVGLFSIVILLIACANKIIAKLLSTRAYKFYVCTGIIGTPIHELGHAVFCPLFGHKITGISLFNPDPANGYLGYVQHSYNPKNLYHRIGCYFIAVGPVLSGTLCTIGLMYLLAPEVVAAFARFEEIAAFTRDFSAREIFYDVSGVLANNVRAVFSIAAMERAGWWLFMALSMTVAMHMTLSKADLRSAYTGVIFVILLQFAACCIVALFGTEALDKYNGYFISVFVYALSLMTVSLVLCGVMIIIAAMINVAVRVFKRKSN